MPAPESVVLETSLGNIQLELYWNHAPRVHILLPQSRARPQLLRYSQLADLREFCTTGKARILQRRDIPSNRRRTSHDRMAPKLWLIYLYVQDFMVQGGDPTGTGRGGTSIYGQKLYVSHSPCPPVVLDCTLTHIHPSSQRRRDPSRATIHRCRDLSNGQLGP